MDIEAEEPALMERDGPPFVRAVTAGAMSGAEMLSYWQESGVFDVPWPQFDEIGEGRRFPDSSEYARHLREQAERRSAG